MVQRLFVIGVIMAAATAAVAPRAAAQHLSVGITVYAPPVVVDLSYRDPGYRPGIVVVEHARPHRPAVHVHRPAKRVVVHRHHHPDRCSGLHTHGKHRGPKRHR